MMTAQTQHTWLTTAVRRKHHVLAVVVTPRLAFGDYEIHKPAPACGSAAACPNASEHD